MSEQRLGILGGMGPQATQDFYQRILDRTDASCDQEHLPTLIWSDTSMPDRTAAILGGDVEGCYRRLLDGARLLERGGCTALAIPCNTSHYFADRLQGDIAIPLIHMPRETVAALAADGKKRAGILATDGTVQTGIYQRECAARGMEGVTPPADVQKLVMSIIYDEIKRGEKGSAGCAPPAVTRPSWAAPSCPSTAPTTACPTTTWTPWKSWRKGVSPPAAISCVWYRGEQRAGVGTRPYVYAPQERHSRGSPCGRLRAETNPAPTPLYPKGPMPTSARAFGLPKND